MVIGSRVLAFPPLLCLALAPGAAAAEEDSGGATLGDSDVDYEGGEANRDVSVGPSSDDGPPAPSPISNNSSEEDPWAGLPMMGFADEGDPCIAYRYVQLPSEEIQSAIRNAWSSIDYVYSNIPELSGTRPTEDCPNDPGVDLPPPMVRDAVRQTVTDLLPRPEPSVPPGYALTGMPAYLVTDHALDYGPAEHPVDLGIMELTVRVEGTGTSTVDWGDGSEPQTYDETGLPYPDGGVKYTYADRGEATITVTDSWRLTFDVYRNGNVIISDIVEFQLNPVALEEPLEIRELRSVRTSSE